MRSDHSPTLAVEEGDYSGVERYLASVSDADIRLLRIFNVVVTAGGLSMATDALQADLSTVSRHIKDLEERVGVRLCNRGRAGFSLTAHGVTVHEAAQQVFAALDQFRDTVHSLHADPVGVLRLGVMDALISDAQFRMSDVLRRFKAKAPRVHIRLSSMRPSEIQRGVLAGDLDLGVVVSRERLDGLRYRQLYLETSSLFCAEGHPWFALPDAKIDLSQARSVDLVEDPYTDSLPLRSASAIFHRAATADSIEAAAMLIRTGNYVGFLPDHYASTIANCAPLRRIRPDLFSYQQGIDLVTRQANVSPFVRNVLAELDAVA